MNQHSSSILGRESLKVKGPVESLGVGIQNQSQPAFLFGDESRSACEGNSQSSSYSSKEESLTSQVEVNLKKISCHSAWCPVCFRRSSKIKIQERLKSMDWKKVRHVVLTIDRDLFKSPKEAFLTIGMERGISNLIWNLKRTKRFKIIDWIWVIEFHKDGFSHWHLFVEMESVGMIGGDNLRKYWNYAKWVREDFFKSEKHWNNVAGYFSRKGYFEKGKNYQGVLPEWAMKDNLRIRRYGKKVYEKVDENREIKKEGVKRMETLNEKTGEINEKQTYEVLIQKCGSQTLVSIDLGDGMGRGFIVDIPYKRFKSENSNGKFIDGTGYVVWMNYEDVMVVMELCEKYRLHKHQWKESRDENDKV